MIPALSRASSNTTWLIVSTALVQEPTSGFRHQAYAYKDPAQKVGRTIFPDALQNGQCEYFLRPRVITSAWGFSHVYSQVRNCDVADLRIQIMGVLGGKTAYYRYHRGEKYLTPELQVAIGTLFKAKGYDQPTFDKYEEKIELSCN